MPLKRMRLADVAAIAVAIPPPLVSIEPETQHPVYLQQWEFMEEADRRLAIEHSGQYADTVLDQPTADTLEDALVDEDERGHWWTLWWTRRRNRKRRARRMMRRRRRMMMMMRRRRNRRRRTWRRRIKKMQMQPTQRKHSIPVAFLISATATSCACVFTNPLECIKTKMQVQNELRAAGGGKPYYRNVFHCFWRVCIDEGVTGLQRGFSCAVAYQISMNGVRLGLFPQFKEVVEDVFRGGNRFSVTLIAGVVKF